MFVKGQAEYIYNTGYTFQLAYNELSVIYIVIQSALRTSYSLCQSIFILIIVNYYNYHIATLARHINQSCCNSYEHTVIPYIPGNINFCFIRSITIFFLRSSILLSTHYNYIIRHTYTYMYIHMYTYCHENHTIYI